MCEVGLDAVVEAAIILVTGDVFGVKVKHQFCPASCSALMPCMHICVYIYIYIYMHIDLLGGFCYHKPNFPYPPTNPSMVALVVLSFCYRVETLLRM